MSRARDRGRVHLRTVYPATDCDVAADGWDLVRWRGRLSVSAGRAPAAGRFSHLQVTTQLPGADPVTMASSVTAPLERQFAEIPGVTQMTSSSVLGISSITVQFDLNRNIDAAAGDIQAAINAAGGQLPKDLPSPPTYRKVNPADSPILIFAVHSDSLPITTVDDYAENILVQNISQIPGVAQVNIGGQQKPAVRIQVDPQKLAAMGIGLEDLRGAVTNVTTDSPKGSIDGATRTFTIYDNDQLLRPSRGTMPSLLIRTARRCACATLAAPSRARNEASWRHGRIISAP